MSFGLVSHYIPFNLLDFMSISQLHVLLITWYYYTYQHEMQGLNCGKKLYKIAFEPGSLLSNHLVQHRKSKKSKISKRFYRSTVKVFTEVPLKTYVPINKEMKIK